MTSQKKKEKNLERIPQAKCMSSKIQIPTDPEVIHRGFTRPDHQDNSSQNCTDDLVMWNIYIYIYIKLSFFI